jgi:hypothetical protein
MPAVAGIVGVQLIGAGILHLGQHSRTQYPYFCLHVCYPQALENDADHLAVCLPRDQRAVFLVDALNGRAKSMAENLGFDLDTDTLDGCSTPSLAPALLELDCEVAGTCKF